MEKLLKDILYELKRLNKNIEDSNKKTENKQKEIINYLAFMGQVQKKILTTLTKLRGQNGDNKQC